MGTHPWRASCLCACQRLHTCGCSTFHLGDARDFVANPAAAALRMHGRRKKPCQATRAQAFGSGEAWLWMANGQVRNRKKWLA
jgi:hypothetical protein